jgi:L-asparaginase II
MRVADGRLFAKAGAEGFQSVGIHARPGRRTSSSLGIAVKIGDGDVTGPFREGAETEEGRARSVVTMEILRQLGVLTSDEMRELGPYAGRPQLNWRKAQVGNLVPAFTLVGRQ